MQLTHNQHKFSRRQFSIDLLCHEVRSPNNLGSIFRIAESFGIRHIYLTPDCPDPLNKTIKKISRHTTTTVPFSYCQSSIELLKKAKEENTKCIALEITSLSQNLATYNFKEEAEQMPILIVIGSESNGVDDAVLTECPTHLHIEMFGLNSSMNVANSLAICLYQITTQLV
jgi:tRNA G18 (ribose-2'-O)-methylase SpoU